MLAFIQFFALTRQFESWSRLAGNIKDVLKKQRQIDPRKTITAHSNEANPGKLSNDSPSEIYEAEHLFSQLSVNVTHHLESLRQLDQAKTDFLNLTTHELRTPLTSIKGALSLLSSGTQGQLPPKSLRLIQVAESETDRMIRLINDLLDLAKIEVGKLPLAKTWIPWEELAQALKESLVGLTHPASIEIKYEPHEALEVYIDRDRIQQVLMNLISNAVKFSPAHSQIILTAEHDADRRVPLKIKVIDSGQGIAPHEQTHIFEKFSQGSSNPYSAVKSSGLGLAIAKALVEQHGGQIGVESQKGHGSVFWFTLPEWRDDESSFHKDPSGSVRNAA
jgi:signal transduction histidine kinase